MREAVGRGTVNGLCEIHSLVWARLAVLRVLIFLEGMRLHLFSFSLPILLVGKRCLCSPTVKLSLIFPSNSGIKAEREEGIGFNSSDDELESSMGSSESEFMEDGGSSSSSSETGPEGHCLRCLLCLRASGNPANDLLDALLRLQEIGDPECPLCEDSLKAVILDIFGAGSEASSTVIMWSMTELVRNPRVMVKLQFEIRAALRHYPEGKPLTESGGNKLKYLNLVIKDTLRLRTPLPLLLPRECNSNGKVTRLMVNAWAIGRDRRHWGDDVDVFRPERFDRSEADYKGAHFELWPFGYERRICPGISFGVAIVEHALLQQNCLVIVFSLLLAKMVQIV